MKIQKLYFGRLPDGREVEKYTLVNNNGMEVDVITYGATITSIRVPGKNREPVDVVLGFDSLEEYLGDHPYFGGMVGRVCNRLGQARFELEGKTFRLTANEGVNQLHGGTRGFDRRLWTATGGSDSVRASVHLGYESPDGEEGYPGTLLAKVEYTLNDRNELHISCKAMTDMPTHVNLTNHSYFNLAGGEGTVLDQELFIDAGMITELDEENIPTGRILGVESTPYDFRQPRAIGEVIDQVDPGYDINYVLAMNPRELTRVATVYHPGSGRSMEVLTTLPGLQLYTANYLEQIRGKGGRVYGKHSALCLETQYFPDAANQPSFPSTRLDPGEKYAEATRYRFNF